jgi:hypothetical protein
MNREELVPWVEKLLAESDKGRRAEIVADLCKEKGLKAGDAWKLLKEAGYDPKAPGPADSQTGAPPNEDQTQGAQESALITIQASHKTEYEKYRCAGLVLTRKPANYLVCAAQLEKLRRDPWVVVHK